MNSKRRLAAIMFVDIVGYTALMGESEDLAFQVVTKFKEIAASSVQKYGGEWHKDLGDGALCSFVNALDAVNGAIDIQRQINPRSDFKVRIGIHLGDVTYRDGDLHGDGINIASRLQGEAAPGGICISESLFKSIRNKEGVSTEYLGKRKLKNVDWTARLYQVSNSGVLTRSSTSVKLITLRKAVILALAVGLFASLFWNWFYRRFSPSESTRMEQYDLILPDQLPLAFVGSATLGIGQRSLAISPKNDLLVYVSQGSGTTELCKKTIDRYDVTKIEGTDGAFFPFFSPDSEWIGFFAGNTLKKVSLKGGLPITLCEVSNTRGACWLVDDRIIFSDSEGSKLGFIHSDGGEKHEIKIEGLSDIVGSFLFPSPLTEEVILVGSNNPNRIQAISIKDGSSVQILDRGSAPFYLNSGHLAYVEHSSLMLAPFDARSLSVTGKIISVIDDLRTENESGQLAVSNGEIMVYAPGSTSNVSRLVWRTLDGMEEYIDGLESAEFGQTRISPDGTKLSILNESTFDLHVFDIRTTSLTRLTTGGQGGLSIWGENGRDIIYRRSNGPEKLARINSTGTGLPMDLSIGGNHSRLFPSDLTSDGKVLAYVGSHPQSNFDLIIHYRDSGEEQVVTPVQGVQYLASFSPDDNFISYTSDESGRSEVYVQPIPIDGNRWTISSDGGEEPIWSSEGDAIYYRYGFDWFRVAISLEPEFRAEVPVILFTGQYRNVRGFSYDIHPEDGRFLLTVPLDTSDTSTRLKVIKGWLEGNEADGSL